MKLYFYFLEEPYGEEPRISFEECEVIEKPKTYKPINRLPEAYWGCYVPKTEIGKMVVSYGVNRVVLTEADSELAMNLFSEYIQKSISVKKGELESLENSLKAVEEWRISHETN